MAEEHEFQAAEGHKLCANNCGFSGSLTTSDLCSKCQRDLRMKSEQNAIAKAALDATPSPLTASASSSSASVVIPALKLPESASEAADRADLGQSVSAAVQNRVNRCVACRKRVGLTGFNCRCGSTFCGSHRYPEKHNCTFDYKTTGKEAIAKANPVVKAAKLRRI